MSETSRVLRLSVPEQKARRLLEIWGKASGKVDLEVDAFPTSFDISKSQGFALMTEKLEYSVRIGESWSGSSPFIDEADVQDNMQLILKQSKLDGFIIVTWDAFPVLEASKNAEGYMEAMPGIGILLTDIVRRAEKEQLFSGPDEITMKGRSGEFIIVRYFHNLEWQFILMAYAKEKCAYRKATNCVMQLCEPVLADFVYI